jgi:CspA family cold shock protein
MPTGKVKFFNEQKGFGFIEPEDGSNDAFVHISAVQAAGMDTLREGDALTYELEESKNGKMAATNLVAG